MFLDPASATPLVLFFETATEFVVVFHFQIFVFSFQSCYHFIHIC